MKKVFPIALMILGLVFLGAGIYTINRGFDARTTVRAELLAQNIVTPSDAAIPDVPVQDVATAQAMADIIEVHALDSTGGLTYAEMGRFATPDGNPAGTNNADEALRDQNGNPVPNGLRNVAFQASVLRTSLYTSVMAFNVADLVVGIGAMIIVLGLAIGGLGVALAGLAIPVVARRLHITPVAVEERKAA